ncbi:TIGR04283 family arsenosugar biosynthesis glycosyltransferase [Thiohalomonas denitrificans]|uniref:Transferase 2, rSAM/selenodomain-associated n=1 Tax=Thiohalomonas denitrificans TaxID=415747 RepID=A0A1G5QAJ3_9GAMM|nr:TIGR04283 family arsenosugar biosynthesis glycosyltransferase [Thiohalomonas denitrificans]SCZ58381.1 transferase 2, rSAM/selenodomain-associated [Thiohalomonas denitrificans]
MLSIIIPALNEAESIAQTLQPLQGMRERGCEVIVADGGSSDATVEMARSLADRVMASGRGRARQMNAGAATASGEVLWFLHADTRVPEEADREIAQAGSSWGRFAVKLSGRHPLLGLVAFLMNRRSCLTGIATGDQGIFVRRSLFEAIGGFPDQPLMEDIALSRLLKRTAGRPACLNTRLITSSRRWEQNGILRTIGLMWWLRFAYAMGASPARLARLYR